MRAFRFFLPLTGVLATLVVAAPAVAVSPRAASAASSPRKVRLFNIAAQPLKAALEAYGAVTGDQIIYDSSLAANRRSSPVVGLFAPETALRMLLDGTDLTIRYTGPGDVTIVSAAQLRAAPSAADGIGSGSAGGSGELVLDTLFIALAPGAEERPDYTDYGRSVRLEIRRALGQNSATAHRNYQVQFDLWVDAEGRVRRPKLLQSSGSKDLDDTILQVIRAITMRGPPPAGMPQPIRVAIVAI